MQLVIENEQLVIQHVPLVTQNPVLYAVSGVPYIHVRLWRTHYGPLAMGAGPNYLWKV